MSDEPDFIICTRLADMSYMHPDQGWELCSRCQHTVGVYPSGKRAIERYPDMKVVCVVCAIGSVKPGDEICPAGTPDEVSREIQEHKPVVQQ
jgi:hypothetical protein